ncbi:glycosyltransferase [bacterium D16-51]|nr:glycosyltransferase [bacterium D16-59]RKI62778.1 glycosyltransferase [bacterium D16-51]
MDRKKKISVIIPCYNAEKTLNRCLNSIINQTIGMGNLEIILVNDASTDSTLQILYNWEKNYPDSILVVHCSENGKQGQARNIGMLYASGEFIGFADDDDYLEENMLQVLYDEGIKNNCDLIVCQSIKHKITDNVEVENGIYTGEVIEIVDMPQRLEFLKRDINIAIWNKIYRRSFLEDNQIAFLPGYIYDDIYFTQLVKQYCKRVYLSNQILYHHIISDTSVSYGAKSKSDRIGFIEVHMKVIEELRNRGLYAAFSEWYANEFMIDYLSFIVNYKKTFGEIDQDLELILCNSIIELFPDWKEISIVKKLLDTKDPAKEKYWKIIQKLMLVS